MACASDRCILHGQCSTRLALEAPPPTDLQINAFGEIRTFAAPWRTLFDATDHRASHKRTSAETRARHDSASAHPLPQPLLKFGGGSVDGYATVSSFHTRARVADRAVRSVLELTYGYSANPRRARLNRTGNVGGELTRQWAQIARGNIRTPSGLLLDRSQQGGN